MEILLIKNNVVENVVMAESLEYAQELFSPTYVCEINENIGIGYYKENGRWIPPKPSDDCTWDEQAGQWDLPETAEPLPFQPSGI